MNILTLQRKKNQTAETGQHSGYTNLFYPAMVLLQQAS